MKLRINGRPSEVPDHATVAQVVADLAGADRHRGVAVAVDGDVVARSAWHERVLADGESVEVLTAIQGG